MTDPNTASVVAGSTLSPAAAAMQAVATYASAADTAVVVAKASTATARTALETALKAEADATADAAAAHALLDANKAVASVDKAVVEAVASPYTKWIALGVPLVIAAAFVVAHYVLHVL